ncbi:MAG TPA: ADP-ribosylglycohydrolase family protein [Phycisphaerae bacterium]|nr:ADP-ribosylglycohydrolase family protein [Phycisphaerae bacterium]
MIVPTPQQLRDRIFKTITTRQAQGHDVTGLLDALDAAGDSYDALVPLAQRLVDLPMRADWPYVEPSGLEEIRAECDPRRQDDPIGAIDPADARGRAETAFLSSVCGCVLGKPVEAGTTLEELRGCLEPIGDWPLRDYVREEALDRLGRRHESWAETVRGRIACAAPDDDISYTLLGMLVLEQRGLEFTTADVADLWLHNLPPLWTWGPERMILLRAGAASNQWCAGDAESWATFLNPGDEFCGAMIRADAYGYACPGRPALAAELAWRDARLSHRRTGIYGAMFAAAAIAAAFVVRDRLEVFRIALQQVPQRSRFYRIVGDSLAEVARASDWLDGYGRIHAKYGQYNHCKVYQETGTLINTLRFAEDIGDGICKQVSQGNDTDSYGCTAGSILGAYFGPGHLDARWLAPFGDRIHTSLACMHEQSLSVLADRIGNLPGLTLGGA